MVEERNLLGERVVWCGMSEQVSKRRYFTSYSSYEFNDKSGFSNVPLHFDPRSNICCSMCWYEVDISFTKVYLMLFHTTSLESRVQPKATQTPGSVQTVPYVHHSIIRWVPGQLTAVSLPAAKRVP